MSYLVRLSDSYLLIAGAILLLAILFIEYRLSRIVFKLDKTNADAVAALKRLYQKTEKWNALLELLKEDLETVPATAIDEKVNRYLDIVGGISRGLFDRDTAPGAEPEDLLQVNAPALIVPGHDATHATSAARYLEECLPKSEYWDVPVETQTETNVPTRMLEFLASVTR